MDVKEIDGGKLSAIAGKKGKKEELDGPDFQKLLKEAQFNQKQIEATTSPRNSVGGAEFFKESILPILSADFTPGSQGPSSLRSQGTQAAEKALGVLEQYQKTLVDPKISLKQIDPLLQSLSQEVKELAKWTEKLPPSDPLQKIMTDIGVLSSVEIERFYRGDYL